MITKEEFNKYLEIHSKIRSICERWIRANPYEGYNSVSNIQIYNDKINFMAYPPSSGLSKSVFISVKYLFDDSSLEKDSIATYELEKKQRLDELDRRSKLENSPDVIEYKKLNVSNLGTFRYYNAF